MVYFIGTDEAGYGPNLGPLTISSTCWCGSERSTDWKSVLGDTLGLGPNQIRLMDSKQVFQGSSKSLEHLERAALVLLQVLDHRPKNVEELLKLISVDATQICEEEFWIAKPDILLPSENQDALIQQIATRLTQQLSQKNCQFIGVRTRVISPQKYNESLREGHNKADLLANSTLRLVRDTIDMLDKKEPRENIVVTCDRFGGRRKYLPLLYEILTDQFVEVIEESATQSVYIIHAQSKSIEIRFVTKGERFLTVAAASIFSKWIRELTMKSWNQYWQKHLPELKPTAGYPVDAPRFVSDIAEVQANLGINNAIIWRDK